MENKKHSKISIYQLFEKAIGHPPSQRPTFLEQLGLDPEAKLQILRLIENFETDSTLIPLHDQQQIQELLAEKLDQNVIGKIFGPYRILKKIGSGGMGTVFLAERADDAFQKQVAIKLVKAATPLFQFQQERQILAQLQHSSIARLLDGGTTVEGTSFFAMDYVKGEQIDQYCDRKAIPVRARIQLIIKLCAAVHYAHQNLVVHGDIKPANILVNDSGNPILIDFGIAKILHPERQINEQLVQSSPWFSPNFASPEQILGDPLTTASDTYAMGLLLHQLITGFLPYEMPRTSIAEMRAFIDRLSLEKPSTHLKGEIQKRKSHEDWAKTGKDRQSTPTKLVRLLRGDLDQILLKSLAKDPLARYLTIQEFADDLQRFVDGLPITARPISPPLIYWKWIKRHPLTSSLFVLLMMLGGWFIAQNQMQYRAMAQERDRTALAFSLLSQFLQVESPHPQGDKPVTFVEMLEYKAKKGVEFPTKSEETQLAGHLAMGEIFLANGLIDPAEKEILSAIGLLEKKPNKHMKQRGRGLFLQGTLEYFKSNYDGAEGYLHSALAIFKAQDEAKWAFNTHLKLAQCMRASGKRKEALPYLESVFEFRQKELRADDPALISITLELGRTHMLLGNFERAQLLFFAALDAQEKNEAGATELLARTLYNIGDSYSRQKKFEPAQTFLNRSLAMSRHLFDKDHKSIAGNLRRLGAVQMEIGRYEEAEKNTLESLAIKMRVLGERHQSLAADHHNLGMINHKLGRFDTAEKYFKLAINRNLETDGPKVNLAAHHLGLGALYAESEAWPLAERQLCMALDYYLHHSSKPLHRSSLCQVFLARCLAGMGEIKASLPLLDSATRYLRSTDRDEITVARELFELLLAEGEDPATPEMEALSQRLATLQASSHL